MVAALRMRQSLSKSYIGVLVPNHESCSLNENYRGSACVPEIVKLPERSFASAGCALPTAIP